MTVLVAQLGDIHLRGVADPVLGRADLIAAAIAAETSRETTLVVLALCGDITYAGLKDQFAAAVGFVHAVEDGLHRRCASVKVTRIVIPGNHDLDLSGDQAAREALLSTITELDAPAQSVQDVVLRPLEAYFAFATEIAGEDRAITRANSFYSAHDVIDGSCRLRLHLFNTAWMSVRREKQGSLHFPLSVVKPPPGHPDCSIALLHHPTHWFSQPHAMRPLRDRLGELATAVLVNHEHVPEATEHVPLFAHDNAATRTVYVSGGVLQEDGDPDVCSFMILTVDADKKVLQLARYEFRGKPEMPYFERTAHETLNVSAHELRVGPAGASLTNAFVEFLDEPGAPITHPHRDPRLPVRLSDIFMYPDLWELDADHKGSDHKQIRSAKVAEEVLASDRVLIAGGEKSGRTAIAKRLFMAAFNAGRVPLLLSGGDVKGNAGALRRLLRNCVTEQYANLSPDQFEQLERSTRVLVVDDVHRMGLADGVRKEVLAELERQFGSVILCGDDLLDLDAVSRTTARESGLWEYRHLVVLGFGEYLREQFVRQWLMLGGDAVVQGEELDAEVERVCALLNVVIKKQLLPHYPLFLLVVLQQSDLRNVTVQGGSYGKLFEGVTTAILNKSRFGRLTIPDKYNYLAALAKRMYDAKAMTLTDDESRQWHKAYWDMIELDIDYDKLVTDLAGLGVLSIRSDSVRFKYEYFFCFFVAYYLHRTVHQPESRAIIAELAQHLHHRVSADIVLFLAHLTGDPIVLDEMIKTCDGLFAGVGEATMGADVEPLNRLGGVVQQIEIPESPDRNRQEMKLRRDAIVEERLAATRAPGEVAPPVAADAEVRRVFDIHAAYKSIQILGQALRNVAGSAPRERKEEVVLKIVGLARRVLGVFLEVFSEGALPHVIEDMAAAHKEQRPELMETELHNEICRHLTGLSQYVFFSMIRHTTFSVGSDNLVPTIHRVLASANDPLVRVLDLSFDLERSGRFPKDQTLRLFKDLSKNPFALSIIRILVAHHMYLYVVPYDERQAVCEKLSIRLLPTVMDKKRKRLTS